MLNTLKIPSLYLFRVFLLFFGLLLISNANGQSYLQRLNNPEISLKQKVAHFSNGDLLIGDSSFEGSSGNGTESLFLTRMDQCGSIVWSFFYEKKGVQLEFRDLKVNERDEIFVFGIASDGSSAVLFLLKVNEDGEKEKFQFFQSDSPSHSAFSLDLRNNKLLVLGSILKIGSPRTGFIALFDTDLNFQWARRIAPFTYEGSAMIAAGNNLVGRSGAFHFQFDESGTLQWAKQFDFDLAPEPIAGPFKVQNGYLYEAIFQDQAFFYKLDPSGRLLWKSALFPSSTFSAAVHEMEDGSLVVHYSAPEEEGNGLFQLSVSSVGEIGKQKKLASDFYFNIGSVFHSLNKSGMVNVIGNKDALTASSVEKTDYLIQFSLNEIESDCFKWVDIEKTIPNSYSLTFPMLSIDVRPLEMQASVPGGLLSAPLETPYYELCGAALEPNTIKVDSLLACDENWQVSLPTIAFKWEDNYSEATRLLEETGTYRARNNDCMDPIIYEYQLDRVLCDCEIFLPNAFSPNGDGQNDVVELFSNCQLSEIQTSVFDRWGNLLYRGQNSERLWDGTVEREQAREGIYILMIDYQLLSESGGKQQGTLTGEVLLIR